MKKAGSFPRSIRVFMSSLVSVFVLLASPGGEDGRPKILDDSGLVVFTLEFDALAPDTIRRKGVFIGDLNETLFLDSLEWRWRLR